MSQDHTPSVEEVQQEFAEFQQFRMAKEAKVKENSQRKAFTSGKDPLITLGYDLGTAFSRFMQRTEDLAADTNPFQMENNGTQDTADQQSAPPQGDSKGDTSSNEDLWWKMWDLAAGTILTDVSKAYGVPPRANQRGCSDGGCSGDCQTQASVGNQLCDIVSHLVGPNMFAKGLEALGVPPDSEQQEPSEDAQYPNKNPPFGDGEHSQMQSMWEDKAFSSGQESSKKPEVGKTVTGSSKARESSPTRCKHSDQADKDDQKMGIQANDDGWVTEGESDKEGRLQDATDYQSYCNHPSSSIPKASSKASGIDTFTHPKPYPATVESDSKSDGPGNEH